MRIARTTVSVVLIAVALLLAPVAAIGTWARVHLVDTDQFVSTFGPLADDPAVQDFVADQVADQIRTQLDLPRRVETMYAAITPDQPRAPEAWKSMQAATTAGIQSLISTASQQVVRSDQFSNTWELSLRLSHRHATAVLGDSSSHVMLSKHGVLSLRIDPFVQAAKDRLVERGMPFVDQIQVRERSVPIVTSDALAVTRTAYRTAKIGGYWLPWAVLALFVAGVLAARRRRRALAVGSLLAAIVFALLSIGVWVGGRVFVGAVSPAQLPAPVATAIFTQVTALMSSTLRALAVLGVLVAVAFWLAGPARPARALRGVWDSGFASLRAALDRQGGDTGAFGRWVDRFRSVLLGAAIAVGVILLFVARPVNFSSIAWLVTGLVLFTVAVDVVRRTDAEPVDPIPELVEGSEV
ncbi:MAG: hypothetical protein QM658_04685 [Gordonia sp. (in: high G+C Gram-positive bacteria)]